MPKRSGVDGGGSAVASLFFLSGAASLGFEVIWSAQLSRILGGSTAAVAFVVAMFMGGMALGYAAGGRWASRWRRPIRAYGAVEICLALLAVAGAWALPRLGAIGNVQLAYLLAGLVLLPCTFLAGVTLPILVAATRGAVGQSLGMLYAINTAGAVFGVLLTGFYLIGAFGLWTSALILGALGFAVGAVAIALPAASPPEPAASPPEPAASPPEPAASPPEPAAAGVARWPAVACLLGLSSLAAEVLWTRLLIPHLNSSTYAFSAILAVFLTGLAGGAAVGGRLAGNGVALAKWLVGSQVAAGLLVVFSPELLSLAEHGVPGYVGVRRISGLELWVDTLLRSIGRAAVGLLPPTFCIGLALPLLVALHAPPRASRGAVAGTIIGWNTVGAVVGSLLARFVLLPSLGAARSLQALGVVYAVAVLLVVQRSLRSAPWVLLAVGLLAVSILRPPAALFLGRLVEPHRLLFVDEGVQDTTAVVELAHSSGKRQIFSNGIAYAGDAVEAQRYMRLLGHLPSLYAREQRRGLVICLGTGMTASAVLRHPRFDTVDLVDISPVVYETLPLFSARNDHLVDNPRGRIHIRDGRVFIAHAAEGSYDTITLEPPPPRAAGVASLYSVEFYRQARRILAEGGAVAQWLPVHGMTDAELAMLTRTFVQVFPDARLIEIQQREAALLATKGPAASEEVIRERAREPSVAQHLANVGVNDVLALPAVRGAALRAAIGEGPVVTDDHPRIEHFAVGLSPGTGADTDVAGRAFLDRVLR